MVKLSTKQMLFLSLNELSQTYPVSKITIDQIVKNCDLKRGTFYYYFKDKEDMIQSMVSEHILQSYKEFYPTGSWKTVLEHGLGFSYKYHRLLRNFYRNCGWLYENLPSVGYQ